MTRPVLDLPERLNAAACLVDANVEAGRGDKVAICDAGDGSTYTYGAVLDGVNRAGNALKALGAGREDRVMLLLFDSPELVTSFFGAIKIGAVPIPANTLLKPHDYRHMLDDSEAGILVVSEALLPSVEPIRRGLRHLRHVVVAGNAGPGQHAYRDIVRSSSPELSPAPTRRDDACFWLYSSGTTGLPKAAVHLQRDMLVCADLYAMPTLGLTEEDRTFSVAKLFFAYGLGNGLYFPFRAGASTVLLPSKPDPQKAFATIERYRPTVFFSVPTGYAGMLAVEGAEERFDTSSLRLCVSAGEALPAALYEGWKARFGAEILDGIGSTEILHIFISNRRGRSKPGSTGEVVPGYEARILGDDGRELPAGETGDLWIRGDSICSCYWNQPERTRETIRDGWIKTGDKYLRDADGYFWHQGRSDDMLKVGGMWVSPVEVESALTEHPAVLESAVVGSPDAASLIKPRAYVVLKPGRQGSTELAEELRAFVKERIAPYKYPRWIEFVPDLPKTATGKIRRYVLRERRPSAGPAEEEP